MHLVPAPPQPVPIISRFDYVAVDAARRRVYAAHTGSQALLVVNADSGAVLGQVDVGPLHGVAVNPATGTVYTGDGTNGTVSEVNPRSLEVVRIVNLGKPIDAIAYDATRGRIYADEDSGNHLFVIDARSFRLLRTIITPGNDHEYLAVDPADGMLYQNIPDLNEFVVINPSTLRIVDVVHTPELTDDHPLQFDSRRGTVIVGGKNRRISIYDRSGRRLATGSMPSDVDQCSLDEGTGFVACAGAGRVWVVNVRSTVPHVVATLLVGGRAHTVAVDPATHDLWTVLVTPRGDEVQRIRLRP